MIKANWDKEYKPKEFMCPNKECNHMGMHRDGIDSKNKKIRFKCPKCRKSCLESYSFGKTHFEDILEGIGLVCSNNKCQAKNIKLRQKANNKKYGSVAKSLN